MHQPQPVQNGITCTPSISRASSERRSWSPYQKSATCLQVSPIFTTHTFNQSAKWLLIFLSILQVPCLPWTYYCCPSSGLVSPEISWNQEPNLYLPSTWPESCNSLASMPYCLPSFDREKPKLLDVHQANFVGLTSLEHLIYTAPRCPGLPLAQVGLNPGTPFPSWSQWAKLYWFSKVQSNWTGKKPYALTGTL